MKKSFALLPCLHLSARRLPRPRPVLHRSLVSLTSVRTSAAPTVRSHIKRAHMEFSSTTGSEPALQWTPEDDAQNAYLEEVLGERAIEFVDGMNARATAALGDPTDTDDYNKVLAILDSKDKIPHLRKIRGMFYNFWQDATNPRGLLRRLPSMEAYRAAEPAWETVLDIDALGREEGESWVYKGQTPLELPAELFPEDAYPRRTLLSLSRGGGDATVVREFDLDEKRFVDPLGPQRGICLPEAKSRVDWLDADTLLVGTDFERAADAPPSLTNSGYPVSVREWARGTPLGSAVEQYRGEVTDVSVSGYVSCHRGVCLEWRSRALTFYTARYQVRRWQISPAGDAGGSAAASQDGSSARQRFMHTPEWFDLKGLPGDCELSSFGDCLVVSLRSDWPVGGRTFRSGSLLSVQLFDFLQNGNSPAEPNTAHFEVLFEPTPESSMEGFTATKNYLIVQSLVKVKSQLTFWRFDDAAAEGPRWRLAGAEPEPAIRGISVRAVDSDEGDQLWITQSSYLQPSTLYLADAAQGPEGVPSGSATGGQERPVMLRALPSQFSAEGLVESQREAVSADGTKVPYFVIGRADAPRDGSTPTLLYGYGGFEISMTPGYLGVTGLMWLERGGCYVVANIRGGGEFGPSWHQAALKENRNKAYEDFIAVAEDLIRSGITSTPHLAIRGGSNGGLLMGNMLTLRPDLFGAVVCAVPLLDMKRYSHLLAGASWMAEYGDPDTADWAAFLHKYSAYHHIDRECAAQGRYPPFLMTTSTRDDRVHPYHARAFVQRLLQAGCSPERVLYYENKEGGHGGAADSKQQAYMTVLYLKFLWKHIC